MGKLHKALNKAEGTRRAAVAIPQGSGAAAQTGGASQSALGTGTGAMSVGAKFRADADPRLPAIADPSGVHAEQYRVLARNLLEAAGERGHKAIALVSAAPGEGRSVTCANLACVLAEDPSRKGVVVDADLRRPTIHKLLGVDNQRGLADYLAGGALLEMALQRSFLPNLWILPAGQPTADSAQILSSQRLDDLVARLRRDYDWVLLDIPSIAAGPDALSVAQRADGVLLVVRMERTPREQAQAAVRALEHANANVVGLAMTALPADA